MPILFAMILMLVLPLPAQAAIRTEVIEYKQGDTVLEGYVAYDDAVTDKRPGVLVVHDWMGFGPFANAKAEELAKLGYVGFAVDIYGKGIRPKDMEEAAAQAGKYKGDRALLRERAQAGLEALRALPVVDKERVAAMGFCFGGTTVLEMARAGMPVRGVVSFHGGLNAPSPASSVKAKVLALHGADDPFVPPEEVSAFQKEMSSAGADWQFVSYSKAVHSFTNPAAGNDPSKGAAYNKEADERSWQAMKQFFSEIFR